MRGTEQTDLLLVDPDPLYGAQLRTAFENFGYTVVHSPNLGSAVEALENNGVDAVLLDPTLPDCGPLDAVSLVREKAPNVPIVVVTDLDHERFASQALRHGVEDFLSKQQSDYRTLERAVRHALERKYAGQALRESEERFRRVFEEGPVGIALVGKDMHLVRVNSAFCQMLGYAEQELTGLALAGITYQDDPPEIHQVERVFRGEIPYYQMEKRFLRKNGSVVWGLLTASVVRGSDGAPLYGIAMVEDITEWKRAEEAVRESHSLLHAVIGGTTDAIYVKDVEGRYLLLNTPAAQMIGVPAADVVGKSDYELLPRSVADRLRNSDGDVLRGGGTRTFEEQFESNGGQRTYLTTKGVYRDESDRVIGLFGIARDITARKRAEDELRLSEAKYRALVDHAVFGIYRSSLDGRFLAVNPALVSMLGYESREELLSVNLRDLYMDPAERERLVAMYKRKRVAGIDVEWKKKDSRRIVVRLTGRPVEDGAGRVEGFEMIVEDVTERRTLEAQLRQAQKMEAVGELTGGIAHDLNNVLTIISANLDLVVDSLPSDQAALRTDLEETLGAARRGRALIRKLLGFSRRSKLEIKPVNPAQLADELLGMLGRVLPENVNLNLVVEDASAVIEADPSAVEQVLINLVTNARDALPDGGTIGIRVSSCKLEEGYRSTHPWAKLETYARISVTDNGEGMDPQVRERVFEPFFTTKPHGVGTGLGMAMVYGLVKQHNGAVEVESEVGKGTSVNLYFPLAEGTTRDSARDESRESPRGGSETILLVEDEKPIRRATTRILERHGYAVITAEDGEEALERYRLNRDQVDLIISDVVMPRLSGIQLLKELRRIGAPRVLFTSGYTARDVRDSGVLDPSVPFLHKPWTMDELLRKVREVLDDATEVAAG